MAMNLQLPKSTDPNIFEKLSMPRRKAQMEIDDLTQQIVQHEKALDALKTSIRKMKKRRFVLQRFLTDANAQINRAAGKQGW